jgi:hypothetical protein
MCSGDEMPFPRRLRLSGFLWVFPGADLERPQGYWRRGKPSVEAVGELTVEVEPIEDNDLRCCTR